jgi:hypothetical protein
MTVVAAHRPSKTGCIERVRAGSFAGVATCAFVAVLSACGGSGSKVAAPSKSTTIVDLGSRSTVPFTIVGGGTPVPTTIVQPHELPAGPIAHAIEVAAAIKAAGLGCDTASIETTPLKNTPGNTTKEQVSCLIADDNVAISLYADHNALVNGLPMLRQASCFIAAKQATNQTYVQGNNWIVFPEQAETVGRMAEPIHGTLRTIHC